MDSPDRRPDMSMMGIIPWNKSGLKKSQIAVANSKYNSARESIVVKGQTPKRKRGGNPMTVSSNMTKSKFSNEEPG